MSCSCDCQDLFRLLPTCALDGLFGPGHRSWVKAALFGLGLGCLSTTACQSDAAKVLASHNAELAEPGTLSPTPAVAAEVYVPVYSRLVYSEGIHLELSALLTVRNTDLSNPIVLESVRYFDSKGVMLRSEIPAPGKLAPMATASFLLKKSDDLGGEGASYLVRWRSDVPVSEPVIEALMSEISGSQSLAFLSRGQVTRTAHGSPLP